MFGLSNILTAHKENNIFPPKNPRKLKLEFSPADMIQELPEVLVLKVNKQAEQVHPTSVPMHLAPTNKLAQTTFHCKTLLNNSLPSKIKEITRVERPTMDQRSLLKLVQASIN